MKKIAISVFAIVMVLGLSSCGKTVGDIDLSAGQSAIYIQGDGKVSYAVSESFDKDYYNKDDLEKKIDNEVSDYNKSKKASVSDAIKVKKFKAKSDVATLVLDFATSYDFLMYGRDYNRFDKDKFYIGSITDNTYCKIKGDFVSPDKKQTVSGKNISKMKDANILILSERYKVQIDGKVLFTSENCSADEDGIITTAGVDDGLSYIVYNND